MVLDQKRSLHVVRSRRVKSDVTLVFKRLGLLEESEGVHRANTSSGSVFALFCAG